MCGYIHVRPFFLLTESNNTNTPTKTGPNDLALALGMTPTSDPTDPAILAVIER
jgi:hypothetical protein